MGMSIDKEQEVKKTLIELLSKESIQVLQVAYIYAKNYVEYGEDVTKTWTTAVQQASVIQEVRQKAWVEAYDSFKKEYENRLKADLKAILVELQLEIEELCIDTPLSECEEDMNRGIEKAADAIQQRINELEENEDGNR